MNAIILAGYWRETLERLGGVKGLVISIATIVGMVICLMYIISGVDLYFREKYPDRFPVKDKHK